MLAAMLLATVSPISVATPQPAATTRPSLAAAVAARMTPQGRPIFMRYMQQTLTSQVRSEAQAQATYRQQLTAVVSAPTLDLDAAQRLIEARKRAEATASGTIRTSAFAMIRTLPAADRKLALTAIFADARPVRQAAPAAAAPGK